MLIFRNSAIVLLVQIVMLLIASQSLRASELVVPGTRGAVPISFEMPYDGEAAVGIYTMDDQLVRIIGQGLHLKKGKHRVDWDGLDLWGRLVPPDQPVQARVIHHQGLRAFYEMSLATGTWQKDAWTWPTRPEKAADGGQVAGGWLGDHSAPSDVVSVGDQVFVSATLAEYGHNLIATDLNGRKRWGTQLAGWTGPRQLFNDRGKNVIAVLGKESPNLMGVDAATHQKFRMWGYPGLKMKAMTVGRGQVHALADNVAYYSSPLKATFNSIDFAQTQPQILSGKSVEFQLSPKSQFNTVFTKGGHFQTGLTPTKRGKFCHILVPFREDTDLGTLIVGQVKGIERIEFYALNEGLEYNGKKHSPIDGDMDVGSGDIAAEEDEFSLGVDDLELDEGFSQLSHAAWSFVADTKADQLMNIVPLQNGAISTRALYVRFVPREKDRHNKKWRVKRFYMCRGFSERFASVSSKPKVTVLDPLEKPWKPKKATGWKLRAGSPVQKGNPLRAVIDYGKPQKMDAIATLNQLVMKCEVDVFIGKGDPATAPESDWQHAATFKGRNIRKTGYTSTSWYHNDQYAHFNETMQTRALRLRYLGGFGRAKVALSWKQTDPRRIDCDFFAPIRMVDRRSVPPRAFYVVHDIDSKKEVQRDPLEVIDVERMALSEDGVFYTVVDGQLHVSTPAASRWQHRRLGQSRFAKLQSMRVYDDVLLVSERGGAVESLQLGDGDTPTEEGAQPEVVLGEETDVENRTPSVFLVDRASGQERTIVGGKRSYEAGPWNSEVVGKISGVALDPNNKVWVAEGSFAPKRVSRFDINGTCEFEVFGPPKYGGGGYLDPSLDGFTYRGIEFGVDFEGRQSLPKGMNRRYRDEQDIASETSTFNWTFMGRIREYGGYRFAYGASGGIALAHKNDIAWEPVFFLGPATSPLFSKGGDAKWREHWLAQDRVGKVVLWRDTNGDRHLQVAETKVFTQDDLMKMGYTKVNDEGQTVFADVRFAGGTVAANLDIYSSGFRIPLGGLSSDGFPEYDLGNNIRMPYPFRTYYEAAASGTRAKPASAIGGPRYVASDGSVAREGQPYIQLKDGTFLGGPPRVPTAEAPSDGYIPPILGTKEQHTLRYAGGALTNSEVGEVYVGIGDKGKWSVISHKYRVVLDNLFDGTEGGWSSDIPPQGDGTFEVTHRKFPSETFWGHFTKAHNGNYYTVVGKGWHALNRIEGLDAIQVQTIPVRNTQDRYAKNMQLRDLIVTEWKAFQKAKKMALTHRVHGAYLTESRFAGSSIDVDGILDEWGGRSKMQPIDEKIFFGNKPENLFFDVAWDQKGLYLAYLGRSFIGTAHDDLNYLFKRGFAFDFRWRANARARGREPMAGDRRLVFGKLNGQYTAALYDYVNPQIPQKEYQQFVSPVLTTSIAQVSKPRGVRVAVQEVALDDSRNSGSVTAGTWLNTVSGGTSGDQVLVEGSGDASAAGKQVWSAEVFVPWSVIGAKPGTKGGLKMKADVGILGADSSGTLVGERRYWSNPILERSVADVAYEALIQPDQWGWFLFQEEQMTREQLIQSAFSEIKKKKKK
jgi:hypothetical protein